MALTYSKGMPLGTRAPAFALRGVDGATYTLESFASARALVIVFTCNHCPYAQASEERLIALQNDYRDRGVQLVAINPNDSARYPDDSYESMVARAREKHFNFPYLHDATQEVARAYDAACTPDVFVFDDQRTLRYNGRIDDNWKEPSHASQHDLRKALDAILEGRPIDFDVVPSMGCSIKWKV